MTKREQNQELERPADVDVDDSAAVLCEREVELVAAEPDDAEARTPRQLSDDAMVDLPRFNVEPIGVRIDPV